jgi:hypothetical protein
VSSATACRIGSVGRDRYQMIVNSEILDLKRDSRDRRDHDALLLVGPSPGRSSVTATLRHPRLHCFLIRKASTEVTWMGAQLVGSPSAYSARPRSSAETEVCWRAHAGR